MRRLASSAVLSLGIVLASATQVAARNLTFEERVKAQEAIERVHFSHQIGTTRLFEEVAPRFVLERKVRAYLKQSAALEKFWNTAVTADLLQQEMARMARQTRMPERLRELYAVLGDDPFLIQECLARPLLVDRLSRNFFAYDSTLHAKTRQEAESLRDDLAQGRLDPRGEVPGRTVVQLIRVDAVEGVRAAIERGDPSRLELQPDAFNAYRDRLPARVGEIAQVQEQRETFVIRVVLNRTEDEIKVGFTVPKLSWEAWWISVAGGLNEASMGAVAAANHALPLPRSEGSGVISDARCPADDTWDNGSLDDLPGPRNQHTAWHRDRVGRSTPKARAEPSQRWERRPSTSCNIGMDRAPAAGERSRARVQPNPPPAMSAAQGSLWLPPSPPQPSSASEGGARPELRPPLLSLGRPRGRGSLRA